VFNFGPVLSSYPDSDHSIRADLWRCSQANSKLILFLEDKSFLGDPITPSDIRGHPYEGFWENGGNTGWTAARWNPTVVARWGALIQAVGAAFASHPNLHGVAFPETATSLDTAERTACLYDPEDYRDSIIAELKTTSDAFPTKRVFWYQNFMPTIAQDVYLDEVVTAVKDYNNRNHGIILGGPDILPDPVERSPGVYSDAVTERCQPRYRSNYGVMDLFCSMQNDSYLHVHRADLTPGTVVTDTRMPGYSWNAGTLWNMQDMFVFARDFLRLNYIIWNFRVAPNQDWEPAGRTVVGNNIVFNQ
jgi:hypothetical protein